MDSSIIIRSYFLWCKYGIPTWAKPAAACLSSRIPHGTPVTKERLSQVEQAEEVLKELGFPHSRVRHHEQVARIEVDPAEFDRVLAQREEIVAGVRGAGYSWVTLDLIGYRRGSLNETLPLKDRAKLDRNS